MKVLIAGSRDITSPFLLERAIDECGFTIEEIVSGGAKGVDTMAAKWAKKHGVQCTEMFADWEGHPERHVEKDGHSYDPRAGLDRNLKMAEYADAAVVITNGSSGSQHMIETMRKMGKPVRVLRYNPKDRADYEEENG